MIKRPATALVLAFAILCGFELLSQQVLDHSVFNLPAQWVLLRGLPLHLAGLLVARAVATTPATHARLFFRVGLASLMLLLVDMQWIQSGLVATTATCLMIYGFGGMTVTHPITGAVWGARTSFSLFMTHTLTGAVLFAGIYPIMGRIVPALTHGAAGWALWFAALAIAIIVADLFDRLIDSPLQQQIRRRWFKPHTASSPISS